jgi:hypothetical protein
MPKPPRPLFGDIECLTQRVRARRQIRGIPRSGASKVESIEKNSGGDENLRVEPRQTDRTPTHSTSLPRTLIAYVLSAGIVELSIE